MKFFKRKPHAEPQKPDIRYAHPSHEEFNRKLEEKRNPTPDIPLMDLSGPWMKPEVLERLPQLRRDFVRSQGQPHPLQDREEIQATRNNARDEQTGSAGGMAEKDKATPEMRPPKDMRENVDRASFNSRWLADLRNAVMKAAKEIEREDARNLPQERNISNQNRSNEPKPPRLGPSR